MLTNIVFCWAGKRCAESVGLFDRTDKTRTKMSQAKHLITTILHTIGQNGIPLNRVNRFFLSTFFSLSFDDRLDDLSLKSIPMTGNSSPATDDLEYPTKIVSQSRSTYRSYILLTTNSIRESNKNVIFFFLLWNFTSYFQK